VLEPTGIEQQPFELRKKVRKGRLTEKKIARAAARLRRELLEAEEARRLWREEAARRRANAPRVKPATQLTVAAVALTTPTAVLCR